MDRLEPVLLSVVCPLLIFQRSLICICFDPYDNCGSLWVKFSGICGGSAQAGGGALTQHTRERLLCLTGRDGPCQDAGALLFAVYSLSISTDSIGETANLAIKSINYTGSASGVKEFLGRPHGSRKAIRRLMKPCRGAMVSREDNRTARLQKTIMMQPRYWPRFADCPVRPSRYMSVPQKMTRAG